MIKFFEVIGSINDSWLCLSTRNFLEFFRLFHSSTAVDQCYWKRALAKISSSVQVSA